MTAVAERPLCHYSPSCAPGVFLGWRVISPLCTAAARRLTDGSVEGIRAVPREFSVLKLGAG
jgi:hypothetical protein